MASLYRGMLPSIYSEDHVHYLMQAAEKLGFKFEDLAHPVDLTLEELDLIVRTRNLDGHGGFCQPIYS